MRYILFLFVFLISAVNADFLNPDEAFKTNVSKEGTNVVFDLKLHNTIYVYDEYIKVSIIKPSNIDITKELKIKEPISYDDFMVHFDGLNIKVPLELIKDKIGDKQFEIKFEYQGCSKKGLCYSPMEAIYASEQSTVQEEEKTTSLFKKVKGESQKQKEPEKSVKNIQTQTPKESVQLNETDTIAQTLKEGNTFLILATFFGFGLLLALTPCIFPMIPILSSIIVRQSTQDGGKMSSTRGFMLSLVYVLSMSAAYTVAGVLAGLFGANIQAMLQNPFVIVSFSAIFVALAFSMFGYYEIALPQSWMSKINKASDTSGRHGGFIGVAIMGFLSALIVGPCVAPPLAGALVYIGQTGDALLGGAALFVMSMGMGLPLLAIGIGAGKYMPKPGGWMTVVSKVFGVIMLAIAIWMLERIIPFVATMLLFALLSFGSAWYLIKHSNRFGKAVATVLIMVGIAFIVNGFGMEDKKLEFKYVKTVQELEQTVKNSDKPVMVDFWATWCVSCKELDNITFKDEQVKKELSKYLLVKIDVTNNTKDDKELMKMFNIFGPPALIFYKEGVEQKQKRIVGYKTAEEFLEIIK